MLSAVFRHRLRAFFLGAASVRVPLVGVTRADFTAAVQESLDSSQERARLTGAPAEAALQAEFRDRRTGQLTLFCVVVGATGAAVLLATEGAPEAVTACVAVLPSVIWLSVLLVGERLRR